MATKAATRGTAAKKAPAPVKKVAPVRAVKSVKKVAPGKKAAPTGKAPALAKKPAPPAKKPAPPAKEAAPPAKEAAPPAKKPAPPAKKPAPPAKKPAPPAKKPAARGGLLVREDESPWTAKELAEVRMALHRDQALLMGEIANAEQGLADLIGDSGDGAGDDQADAGSKTFEREHEMSLANNARAMLDQVQHSLDRIDTRTYGTCESCGAVIGKPRLQAFPRATLCMSCKQAEERH